MGLLGQNINSESNRVWITKTHYPRGASLGTVFEAQKMIVIARNPIDVIPSYANLRTLKSHSLEPNERYDIDKPEFWAEWVPGVIAGIKENHELVLSKIASKIPTFFMRYEDLKTNPVPVLTNLFCFLLSVDSIEGTNCARRIKDVTSGGFSDKTAYALKSNSMSLCRNRHMYSQAQISLMRSELADMIAFWEYNMNRTCFFYGVKESNDNFRKFNERQLQAEEILRHRNEVRSYPFSEG